VSGPAKSEFPPPALLGDVLAPAPLKPLLNLAEQKELAELETVIKSGWKTFLEVGSAVAKIRDKELFRDKYETFEQYLLNELGYSLPYAYSLMGSAEVNAQLSAIAEIKVKPLNEAQFRELIPVPVAKRAEAWKSAVELAGDAPITAKIVHQAAAKFRPNKTGKKAKAAKKPAATKIDFIPALKLLARVEKAASVSKDKAVAKELLALRRCLEALAKK
jgi:hypothetical protein